jgi:hypothetical protein
MGELLGMGSRLNTARFHLLPPKERSAVILELEADDELFVQSSPELLKAIHRAVQMTVRNFRANPAPSILSSNTVNGNLDCGVIEPLRKPQPDALQVAVEAGRKDSNDLCRTRS